jgi:hypothetical protein
MERELIARQLCMKDDKSHSWVTELREATAMYHLPSPFTILDNPPPKSHIKRLSKTNIMGYWFDTLKKQYTRLPSLRYLNPGACGLNKPHHVWRAVAYDTREVRKATIKAKVLLGKYKLQTTSQHWGENAACPLCAQEAETREHFVLACPALESTRSGYLIRMEDLLLHIAGDQCRTIMENQPQLLQLLLDCTAPSLQSGPLTGDEIDTLEGVSRGMIYALHSARTKRLGCCPMKCSDDTACSACNYFTLDPTDPQDLEQPEHQGAFDNCITSCVSSYPT